MFLEKKDSVSVIALLPQVDNFEIKCIDFERLKLSIEAKIGQALLPNMHREVRKSANRGR